MEFLGFVYEYFIIHNIEILGINWKLWCYKKTYIEYFCDFLDLHFSAIYGIFIQAGAIILDAHALNVRRSMLLLLLSLFSRPL